MTQDIHLVMCAIPAYGHVRAVRALARTLVARDYSVTFVTGNCFAKSIQAIEGVELVTLDGKADYDLDRMDEYFPGRQNTPKGPERVFHDIQNVFIDPIPSQHETLKKILNRPALKDKKIVVLADAGFMGTVPMLQGASDVRRVPVIGIGSFPLLMMSKDTPPFGMGLPSQGEETNMAMNAEAIKAFSGVQAHLEEILKNLGCTKPLPTNFPTDAFYLTPDLYVQCSIKELEPPRTSMPSTIHYVGSIPGGNDKKPLPPWFQDFVVDDATGRPLILLTQGTVQGSTADELILPTITACKDLDVRVIVCGVNVVLPAGEELPANVRWAEWIAFESVFPHTSIIVSNGGYGGINQAFAAGIPMVVAGTTEEKTETTLRAAMTGAAINLAKQEPSAAEVKDALIKVLNDPSYKERALELQKAFAKCDALRDIEMHIVEVAEKTFS